MFLDWGEVVHYCLSSKCVPTLLFYEISIKKENNDRFIIDEDNV